MNSRWSVVVVALAIALLAGTAIWAAESTAPAGKPDGKALFTTYKCTSCHSIESQKIEKKKSAAAEGEAASTEKAKKVPDLSDVGSKKDAAWLSKYLMKEEKLNDKLHKAVKFKGTPEELKTLSTWMATLKVEKEGEKAPAETPAGK